MMALSETKEGKEFNSTIERDVETIKIADANVERNEVDVNSPSKPQGMKIS